MKKKFTKIEEQNNEVEKIQKQLDKLYASIPDNDRLKRDIASIVDLEIELSKEDNM